MGESQEGMSYFNKNKKRELCFANDHLYMLIMTTLIGITHAFPMCIISSQNRIINQHVWK